MNITVDQVEKRSWLDINLSQILENYRLYKSALKKMQR